MDTVVIKNKPAKLVHCSALEGVVVSSKMNKSIVVRVQRLFKHPVLGKVMKRYKQYMVHDETQLAQPGDVVEIVKTRPISKKKHMVLTRVVRKAKH